jgi:hypothetical protein
MQNLSQLRSSEPLYIIVNVYINFLQGNNIAHMMMDFILAIYATTAVLIAFACDSKWTCMSKYAQIDRISSVNSLYLFTQSCHPRTNAWTGSNDQCTFRHLFKSFQVRGPKFYIRLCSLLMRPRIEFSPCTGSFFRGSRSHAKIWSQRYYCATAHCVCIHLMICFVMHGQI